jgi:hypothetical protein
MRSIMSTTPYAGAGYCSSHASAMRRSSSARSAIGPSSVSSMTVSLVSAIASRGLYAGLGVSPVATVTPAMAVAPDAVHDVTAAPARVPWAVWPLGATTSALWP